MTLPDRLRAWTRPPVHEPAEDCLGIHCHWHQRDEQSGYRDCFECGHAYRFAWTLRLRYTFALGWRDWRGFWRRLRVPIDDIYFCPLCAHNF